jgi:serine/threonine protein kinase
MWNMKHVILAEPSTVALFVPVLFVLVLGALIFLGVLTLLFFLIRFLLRKTKNAAPPAPPIVPIAQTPPKNCPKCGARMPPDSPEGLCPRCLIGLNLATQTDVPGEPDAPKVPPGPPAPVADVAKLFPQLEILECLGRGGMGAVYKVRQPRLDRVVALKILSPEKQGNQKFADRFEREARALAKLHHPNIVTVFDFGEVEGNFYLLMEFVDGLSLRQLLQQRKLTPPEALAIVPKICEALQYAHQQGIVHRDIKPENILMDKEGHVKIADFGIAKILGDNGGSNLTAEQVIGTPHYMSPEQIEKPQAVDHRADIYSLGVVFYEMLTSELPLGKFQPPSKKVQVDVRLDEIVLRALEKEPERRYQQASEVKTQVEKVAGTTPESSGNQREEKIKGPSWLTMAATAFRRGAWVALSIFLLVTLAAFGITALIRPTYRATTEVSLKQPSSFEEQFQIIRSSQVLEPVAVSLDLPTQWGRKFNQGHPFDVNRTIELMRNCVTAMPVPNTTDLINVDYYSDSPREAAEIANAIAETYCALPPAPRGEIILRASPPSRPIGPNVAWNIFTGIAIGLVLGISAGTLVGLVSFWRLILRALEKEPERHHEQAGEAKSKVKPKTLILGLAIIVLSWMAGILVLAFESGRSAYIAFQLLPFVLFIFLPGMIIYFVWRARENGIERALDGRFRFALLALTALFIITLVVFLVTRPAWQHGKDDLVEVPSIEQIPAAPGTASEIINTNQPKVIWVSPADGADNVDPQQDLRIRFDQPMNPNDMNLMWSSGGFLSHGQFQYNPARNEFDIPLQLVPGKTNKLMASWAGMGFRNTNSIPAEEFDWQFTTKPSAPKPGAPKPNVVQISPEPGEPKSVLTMLEITFDQPMTLDHGFPWLRDRGASFNLPGIVPDISFAPSGRRLTVPLMLPPDNETKLTLEGFHSADGVASDPVVVRCEIGTNNFSGQQLKYISTAAKDPKLTQLLSSMKTSRAGLASGIETVKYISLDQEQEAFNGITAYTATFKWQGTNQFYEDISEVMGMGKAFILASDGQTCWMFSEDPPGSRRSLMSSPVAAIAGFNASIADPFNLAHNSVQSAIEKGNLVYEGQTQLDGRPYYQVSSWLVNQTGNDSFPVSVARTKWWIDSETFLPAQVIRYISGRQVFRFKYEGLNQPLPAADFQSPATPGTKSEHWFDKKLGTNEVLFLKINDGSDGQMSGRIGKRGPNGEQSSGLN